MHLSDILDVGRIDTDFTATSKSLALAALSKLLVQGAVKSGTPASSKEVLEVLSAREALQSTGVGSGVAIPHGRVAHLDRFIAALAIHRRGVDFASIDGKPVSILFAVIGPEKAPGDHQNCLARIGRLLRDDSVRARLQSTKTAKEAMAIVCEVDGG